MNRRPHNLQSYALPLSYRRTHNLSLFQLFEKGVCSNEGSQMSSKEALYANLADRIVRLNEEMIRFTRQAEATQQVVAKASEVTTLYYNMFRIGLAHEILGLKPLLLLNNSNRTKRM